MNDVVVNAVDRIINKFHRFFREVQLMIPHICLQTRT